MADDKTEQATPKKLRDARRRGEVPRSQALGTAAVVLGATLALVMTGRSIVEGFVDIWTAVLRAIEQGPAAHITGIVQAGASTAIDALAPLLVTVFLVAGLTGYLQVGPLFSHEPVLPKFERIDPVRGAKNLFTQRRLVDLCLSIVKIVVIVSVAWFTLAEGLRGIIGLLERGAADAIVASSQLGALLLLRVGVSMAGIAIVDVIYQRWRFQQDQRMSKHEVKREYRESEGDPRAKQHREQLHREIATHATLEDVRQADVLIVNPTHLAVAVRYANDESDDRAPEVVAKGQEGLARRMIKAAEDAGVPVMRDVPLAQALWDLEIGDEIPESLYEAVAIVLQAAWAEQEGQAEQ